jgi:alkylhydroperoxidase family enzyme
VSDALYAATREHFSEEELVDLTMAIVTINGWNRISHAFGAIPGSYREPRAAAAD